MPHPGWSTTVRADVPAKINTGLAGAQAGEVHDETERRKLEDIPQAAQPRPAEIGGSPGGPPALLPPLAPAVPLGPDRFHKESGGLHGAYVTLGPDHGPLDIDSPTNPGYRTAGVAASSMNDALTKAIALQRAIVKSIPLEASGRVAIVVFGGVWYEDVIQTVAGIDWIGLGRPMLRGHLQVTSTCSDFRMSGFECWSTDIQPAAHVLQMLITRLGPSPIEFRDVWFHGSKIAFQSERRVELVDCRTWWDDPFVDIPGPIANSPVILTAALDDNDFSVARNCHFRSYLQPDAVPGVLPPGPRHPSGFALWATGKINGAFISPFVGFITHQTTAYQIRPMSGLLLDNCRVDGSLRCEGWVVKHVGGMQIGSMPTPTLAGTVYAVASGWRLGDYGQVPGIVQFDDAHCHAAEIAVTMDDIMQPGGWGGSIYFRGSQHLTGSNVVGPSAIGASTSTTEFFHDGQSSTPCAAWISTGTAFPDNTTGTGMPIASMYDPHVL